MGARTERIERRSQATPLAEDVLSFLQGHLDSGAFGTGVGPLQREAGTAARQFLSSLRSRPSQTIDPTGLIDAVTARSRRSTAENVAGLREAFSAAGSRFGTQIARGEGNLRARSQEALDEVTARTLLGAEQFNAQQGNVRDQLILSGINNLFQQGQANIMPFLSMAQLGILPEEIIQKPSVAGQIASGVLNAGAAIFGGPAGPMILESLGIGGAVRGQGGMAIPNLTPRPVPQLTSPPIADLGTIPQIPLTLQPQF